MYHIKSDRRSQASAAEIVRGLQECLKTTPMKSITVSYTAEIELRPVVGGIIHRQFDPVTGTGFWSFR